MRLSFPTGGPSSEEGGRLETPEMSPIPEDGAFHDGSDVSPSKESPVGEEEVSSTSVAFKVLGAGSPSGLISLGS